MIMQDNERLLTMKEAKRLLGVQTITIQRWDKQGKIRIVRTPGGRRRVPLSEVKRIMTGTETRSVDKPQNSEARTNNGELEDEQPAWNSRAEAKSSC